ncbi:MAG: 2-C-methyl-D-erythritol 4-phosphate cytidylyltransferase [Verrucomicrobiota bacterium]|nr:MAG: 2-C-methyl-D-erythritol 4-phosphate cytidylyltransferase [Verrucomicrobiota bacterium]
MQYVAIILVAGQSQRWSFGDKCLAPLNGIPAYLYSLHAFISSGFFNQQIIVCHSEEQRDIVEKTAQQWLPQALASLQFILGGAMRTDSVFNALEWIFNHEKRETIVFIHDGARPLLTAQNLENLRNVVTKDVGATLAHRITDTVLWEPQRTYPPREQLWALETPQAFYLPQLYNDYQKFFKNPQNVTDDTGIYTGTLKIVENHTPNFKLTYPQDRVLIEFLLSEYTKSLAKL